MLSVRCSSSTSFPRCQMLKKSAYTTGEREREKMPLGKYHCNYATNRIHPAHGGSTSRASLTSAIASFGMIPSKGGLEHLFFSVMEPLPLVGLRKYGDACKYDHPKLEMANPTPVSSGEMLRGTVSNWGILPLSLQPFHL
ncbi:Zinc finger CCCH domain-containing protein 3 [Rhynchospora pubera]|uniref:Zinc finger CCCH domain-containing protein 3 n=1 Tax=Rhynchospora pubera TaxID=906938 RepID=A0AAV8FEN8_9POAL|nr:Zinc finger CCCH domain-containing protein 3 [Rhynchospora pubera]